MSNKAGRYYADLLASAVDEAPELSASCKAILQTLVRHCNSGTGEGWAGQETIARWSGYSPRAVWQTFATFTSGTAGPIRIERKVRFRKDGRGRTSDYWRLSLSDQPAPQASSSGPTNRQEVHVEAPTNSQEVRVEGGTNSQEVQVSRAPKAGLTRNSRTTNSQEVRDQLAGGASISLEPFSDPFSDPICIGTAPKVAVPKAKPAKKEKAKAKAKDSLLPPEWQPSPEHKAFAGKHQLNLELEALGFRGHYEGKRVLSWNGRFTTWLTNQAKWSRERGGSRRTGPKQPNSGYQSRTAAEGEY